VENCFGTASPYAIKGSVAENKYRQKKGGSKRGEMEKTAL